MNLLFTIIVTFFAGMGAGLGTGFAGMSAACLDQQEANGVSCTGGCSTGNAHNARSKGITETHQDAADRQDRDGEHQCFAQFLEILHHKAHSSLRNVCVYRRLWLSAVHNSVIE